MPKQAPKRSSGPTQPEHERKRPQKLLRLSRWHQENLALLAESEGVSESALVERLVEQAASRRRA